MMSSAPLRGAGHWDADAVKQAILPHLSTLATEWGVKLTGKQSQKGWLECHAIGREDSTPSAGIHLESGVYKDQGGGGETLSVFDLAVKLGVYRDFPEAVNILGERYGVRGGVDHSIQVAIGRKFAGTALDGRPTGQPKKAPVPPKRIGKPTFEEAVASAARSPKLRNIKAEYRTHWTYSNADGTEALRIVRFATSTGKEYRPVHQEPGAGWFVMDPPGPLPLYGLPRLLAADGSRPVFVLEGEKVADLARGLGLLATTSSHGAHSAAKSDWSPLAGRDIVIVPDAGKAGEGYKTEVAKILSKLKPRPSVRILELPDLAEGEDLEQWLEQAPDGWDEERCGRELLRLAESATDPRPDAVVDPEGGPATIPIPGRFDLGIIGMTTFITSAYPREWLIKRILVKGKPAIIGGPKKNLKTSFVVDLAMSLAGAGRFLGEFDVPAPVKTLVISGESGEATIQETVRRVCRAKGIYPDELEGSVFWGFTLPQLSNPQEMEALGLFIRSAGIECVVIDPLYLCLIGGGRRVDMANLFEVGPLLKAVSDLCIEAGATPLLVTHFRKNRQAPFESPDMEDLAFAGVQEFARQWILLGRREAYQPGSGEHNLWLSVGGSDGHSGEWSVDVSEGTLDEDFRDREWRVAITSAPEAIEAAKDKGAKVKAEKLAQTTKAREYARERAAHDDAEITLDALAKSPDRRRTKNSLRDSLAWSGARINQAIGILLQQRRIKAVEKVEFVGDDGKNRTSPGFEFVTSDLPENVF